MTEKRLLYWFRSCLGYKSSKISGEIFNEFYKVKKMTENKRFTCEFDIGEDYPFYMLKDGENILFQSTSKIEVEEMCDLLNELSEENEHYKSIFFELVETALTDKNCRELYCKGILDIFDKANSLNQARDMIKEHLK